jgi:hypothetical protein
MPIALSVLYSSRVRTALAQAWLDSQPGETGGHEEGGFILRGSVGNLSISRWSQGEQNTILLPIHIGCKLDGLDIVASFHTHPNTGKDYLQEPSETDKHAVQDDKDLKGSFYEKKIVISQNTLYLIEPNGQVSVIGNAEEILEPK